jgi:hypothetical protein
MNAIISPAVKNPAPTKVLASAYTETSVRDQAVHTEVVEIEKCRRLEPAPAN